MKGGKNMNAEKCLKMLREIKDVAFATVDEFDMPQIRIIDVMLVDKEKLYFCTARGKEFYHQLIKNGNVAITGMNKQYQMIRLNGKAKKLDEQKKWIDKIFEENESMNSVYPNDSRYILEPFVIDNGEVEFFDLGKEPIQRQTFKLGLSTVTEKGYEISDKCIKCRKCERICPQKCINDFTINQSHCLHCGLCFESCPVKAIVKRGEEK